MAPWAGGTTLAGIAGDASRRPRSSAGRCRVVRRKAEVGAAGESPVARSGPPRGAATSGQRGGGCRAGVVGLALRFALNAPPFGLRRATLRARPTTKKRKEKSKNQKQKGDISNEVRKGTFLTSFDTNFHDA